MKISTRFLQDEGDKLVIFERGDLVFVFNFHPTNSYSDYRVGCKNPSDYKVQSSCAMLHIEGPLLGSWDAGPARMFPMADLHALMWRPLQCSTPTSAGHFWDQQATSEDARWCAKGQLHKGISSAVCLWQKAALQADLALGVMKLDLCASSRLPARCM